MKNAPSRLPRMDLSAKVQVDLMEGLCKELK